MSETQDAFVCSPEDGHSWSYQREPHAPIWIVQCMVCGRHNFDEMLRGWTAPFPKSEWFDLWASDPKLVRYARRRAVALKAERELKGAVFGLLQPGVDLLGRLLGDSKREGKQ